MSCVLTVNLQANAGCPANAVKDARIVIDGVRNCTIAVSGYQSVTCAVISNSPTDPTVDFDVTVTSPGCKTVKVRSVRVGGNKTITVRLSPK